MGCDGNNQLFPLAFAIIEGENIDSWGWFLACIRNKVTQHMRIYVISDRHSGIMITISDLHLGWVASYTTMSDPHDDDFMLLMPYMMMTSMSYIET